MRFLNFFPVHLKLLSIRTRDTHVHPRLVAGGWARPSLLLAGRLFSKQRGFICSGAGGHEKACPPMRGLSPAAPGPRPLCADGLTVTLLQLTYLPIYHLSIYNLSIYHLPIYIICTFIYLHQSLSIYPSIL